MGEDAIDLFEVLAPGTEIVGLEVGQRVVWGPVDVCDRLKRQAHEASLWE
jgi:hypothetical protein